jgi:hypothetical protein
MTQAASNDAPPPPAPPADIGGAEPAANLPPKGVAGPKPRVREIGGPKGPEPTRYGDWEVGGRCSDF